MSLDADLAEHSETGDYLEQLSIIAQQAHSRSLDLAWKAMFTDDPEVRIAAVDAYIKAFIALSVADIAQAQAARLIWMAIAANGDYAAFVQSTIDAARKQDE